MISQPTPGASDWRRVARSMAAGAAYDAAFGITILFFADPAARWMRLTLPDDRAYLGLNGVFLLLLAGLYMLPARDPQRYGGVVGVAAVGRLVGAIYLGTLWMGGQATAFLWLAVGDLAFAVIHATLWMRALRHAQVADRPGA